MDNAQKAIMVGVGLFITIIIVSAVMLITSAGQDLVDESMTRLSSISNQLSSTEWNALDGKYMNGAQVIAYAKKYYNANDFLCYYEATNGSSVVKVSNLGIKVSGSDSVTSSTVVSQIENKTPSISSMGKITDSADTTTYVSTTANYQAILLKTSAGDPVGVYFDKQ